MSNIFCFGRKMRLHFYAQIKSGRKVTKKKRYLQIFRHFFLWKMQNSYFYHAELSLFCLWKGRFGRFWGRLRALGEEDWRAWNFEKMHRYIYNTMYYIVYVCDLQKLDFILWLSYGYVVVIIWYGMLFAPSLDRIWVNFGRCLGGGREGNCAKSK